MAEITQLGDERIYRLIYSGSLDDSNNIRSSNAILIKPFLSRQTFIGDFHETPMALARHTQDVIESIDLSNTPDETKKKLIDDAVNRQSARLDHIKSILENPDLQKDYAAPASMMHPYALLRLAGVKRLSGSDSYDSKFINLSGSNIIDSDEYNRWYETVPANTNSSVEDAGVASGEASKAKKYAKNPTTIDIINWSQNDLRGRFPYSFQDFVFCKYWNKIQNNRMITLRRYPAPTTDNVEPENYLNVPSSDESYKSRKKDAASIKQNDKKYEPFAPVASAITFFGEGTDNSLKDILNFAVGYNWEEMTTDVWDVTSNQIEEGQVFNSSAGAYLNGGMQVLAQALGIIRDLRGEEDIQTAHAVGLPPDPYERGPYENRVVGPVNCINNVYKRKRGLVFNHDSLTIKFEYMSRPIAHVNNKAILLDCLSNILALTSSSGTWFGGAHKYRNERPAIYPWRNQNTLNKIYSGKIFGKNGAFGDMFRSVFNGDNKEWLGNFAKGILDGIKAIANDIVAGITGKTGNANGEQKEETVAEKNGKRMLGQAVDTVGRAVAAHMLKGQSAPWLTGAKALLNGDPVGDWHLTIGNPLNPIAMIGNLILEDCHIEFSDELGPDDFPLGFSATIQLKHGMGRDRDAVESMFNRGIGRMYILSDAFKTSADSETSIDDYTGSNNPLRDKVKIVNKGIMVTSGSFGIIGSKTKSKNTLSKDRILGSDIKPYNPADINMFSGEGASSVINLYKTTPWAMHQIL